MLVGMATTGTLILDAQGNPVATYDQDDIVALARAAIEPRFVFGNHGRDVGIVLERERRIPLMLRGEGSLRRSSTDLERVILALPGGRRDDGARADGRRGREPRKRRPREGSRGHRSPTGQLCRSWNGYVGSLYAW